MKPTGLAQVLYLAWLSQPAAERGLYRHIVQRKVSRIVELGVGDGRRARRLITAALRHHKPAAIRYAGIDLFEARPSDQPGMTLKRAHRHLGALGVRLRLVPGDPYSALARTANALTGTDLLLISADQDAASLTRAWFYVPRMLHQDSLVFQAEHHAGGIQWTPIPHRHLAHLAKAA